ncbi:hypothetical protein DAEQUDRAFT_720603 [Daedalea quercina L-15889]|uniref:Uncharacterized protein n=1 Tax=Daedalea quercina L-15889 TaxID=1314783 RepID=A0A165U5R4_9APHY|nr:hypothetical protein DAEQUDRAFT_720603 [Daedalea quercina L-15889]
MARCGPPDSRPDGRYIASASRPIRDPLAPSFSAHPAPLPQFRPSAKPSPRSEAQIP